jgi:hypothetical protein
MTGLHPAEMAGKARRGRAPRRRNHYAKTLSEAKYRPRIVSAKTTYSRKMKHTTSHLLEVDQG